MTDLYLIAHKVHGAPAFDIAHRIGCPECSSMGCLECDDLGYWWIVGTSGHRAYPYQSWKLFEVCNIAIAELPADWPDHYPHSSTPTTPRRSLAEALGLTARPQPPVVRRF